MKLYKTSSCMKLNYELSNEDFIIYQLYTSSRSKIYRRKRAWSRAIIPVCYAIYGIFRLATDGNYLIGCLFLALAAVWFQLYPIYSKWKYRKLFSNHLQNNYEELSDMNMEIIINKNSVDVKDYASKSNIKANEFQNLIELVDYFILNMFKGRSFIIPKSAIKDHDSFKQKIAVMKIDYLNELNWKWS